MGGFLWLALLAAPPDRPAPRAFAEEVTVTASRRPEAVADTPAAVSVLTAAELALTAAPPLDEALRQAPGFALFRRAGSRTSNPTSQGVTLRGLGGSGASRAAVLDDGLPLNDPFGGWVHWSRVPLAAVDRVEVLRGGASSLYGTGALAGVIQVVRRDGGRQLHLDASLGTLGTRQASGFGAASWRGFRGRASAEVFETGGYVAVREAERGPVDAAVASRHTSLDLAVERGAGAARAFLRGAFFDDERDNGTPLQVNDTRLWQGAAGADAPLAGGIVQARGHLTHEVYRQDFSAIDEDRRGERLTRTQRVPADAGGLSLQWTRAAGRHVLTAGAEAQEVGGASEEEAVTPGGRSPVRAEGRQRAGGVYAEHAWSPGPRWLVTTGARWDGWRNFGGRQQTASARTDLPDRGASALSPRLALRHRPAPWLAVSASAYGAFRAPTLNELYRSFRVGNVVTEANAQLGAERSRGAELGALVGGGAGLSARLTTFWMEVDDTIGNVTLSATPALVTRRRQNVGRIRSRGAELELEARPASSWAFAATAAFADATVRAFAAQPALEERELPQVSPLQLAAQARYQGRRLRAGLQARWASRQFEDDRNELPLAPLHALDAMVAWTPGRRWQAYVAVENATGAEHQLGRTPVVTLGPPRTLRVGVRLAAGPGSGMSVAPP